MMNGTETFSKEFRLCRFFLRVAKLDGGVTAMRGHEKKKNLGGVK
jgi:hypothetical protein